MREDDTMPNSRFEALMFDRVFPPETCDNPTMFEALMFDRVFP